VTMPLRRRDERCVVVEGRVGERYACAVASPGSSRSRWAERAIVTRSTEPCRGRSVPDEARHGSVDGSGACGGLST